MRSKLKISDIKKYNDVSIDSTIKKIKKHERKIVFILTSIFVITIPLVLFIIFYSINNTKIDNEMINSNNLEIYYYLNDNIMSNIITLDKNDILLDSNSAKGYKFKIKNISNKKIKYNIFINKDNEMIKLDECSDILVDNNIIKYNIYNKTNYLKDTNKNNIYTSYINKKEEREIKLKVWIDKNKIKNIENNHFHGKIVVTGEEIEE